MDDLERERVAMSLLGDVLIELSRRDSVRRVFRSLAGSSGPGQLTGLVDDFERAVNERYPAKPPESQTGSGAGHTTANPRDVSLSASTLPPPDEPAGARDRRSAVTPPAAPEQPESAPRPVPAKPVAPEPQPASPTPVDQPHPKPETVTQSPAQPETTEAPPAEPGAVPDIPVEIEGPLPLGHPHEARIAVEVGNDDYLYLHGVSAIPLEERPAPRPFILQEKGIDGRDFAFAVDRGGLRFYCSKMTTRAANVSKAGILLLGKQESVHLRGVHEGILNELRQHGVLLPFVFGTVALGRDDLFDKIDAHLYDLRDAVDEQMATGWWNLNAFMLDAKLAQMLGEEPAAAKRDRERPRSRAAVPGPSQRIGIKTLERILGKQKKIAESIHEELKKHAQRADVDLIVGFNSGTSDEWKLILKSSYEIRPSGIQAFNRAITTIQYRHFLFELMLSLEGDREPFSFQRQ